MKTIQEFITGDIWNIANKKMPERGKEAAIAYVTSSVFKLASGDTLICNASDYAIKNGQTDANVLKYYFDKGVDIFSNSLLHCKLAKTINTLIIGSANHSKSSSENLIEGAIVTNDPSLLASVKSFIYTLKEEANTNSISKADLTRLLEIPVVRKPYNPIGKSNTRNKKFGGEYWVISTHPSHKDDDNNIVITKRKLAKHSSLKEETINYIRWSNNDKSRFHLYAKGGDQILNIYKESKLKTTVYYFTPILKIQKRKKDTIIYYCDSNLKPIEWATFLRKIQKIDLRKKRITKNSVDTLSKNDAEKITTLFN